jgi:hypothetical protein
MSLSFKWFSAALLGAATVVSAAQVNGVSVSPTKANGDFIPGTGIPASDFAVDSAPYAAIGGATTVEVGLKAHGRQGLYTVTRVADRYYAPAGSFSLSQPNLATWNFAFQVSPGENGAIADGLKAFVDVDFNPAFGATDYATFGGTIPDPNFALLGFNIPNPGSNAWSSNGVDLVVAGSENLGFNYWGLFGKTFNPNAIGEYQINFRVQNNAGTTLASSTIYVITPEPASLSTLALAGLMLRRRR